MENHPTNPSPAVAVGRVIRTGTELTPTTPAQRMLQPDILPSYLEQDRRIHIHKRAGALFVVVELPEDLSARGL